MKLRKPAAAVLNLAAIASGSAAAAQDAFLGKQEFAERCAICHGAEGAGDGAVGDMFSQRPADLRRLAKDNGGTDPFTLVFESIDRRRDISAHGGTEMPIWGDYLMSEAAEFRNMSAEDATLIVEARIKALVHHLQSIQMP